VSRAEEFLELRSLLFSIAYRILGSVTEAEDAVQETWLRYSASPSQPASARAFLSATVTRVSIDVLRSARVRREQYAGQWFPEPLLTDPYEDPERSAELADSVSMAALMLLERLSPLERAVFVLREVFGFSFPEVAAAVGRSETACRQLAVRARRHMDAGRPRFAADRREREELASRFFGALREGDVAGLRELLAADVQVVADSGDKAPQLAKPVAGADNVARVLAVIFPRLVRIDVTAQPCLVNGQPGAIFRDRDGKILVALMLDIFDGRIQVIRSVQNPDKLAHLGPVADAWAVAREASQVRRAVDLPQGQPRCPAVRRRAVGRAPVGGSNRFLSQEWLR
jgi:RNA polymerase sigma-70 factor (ECF subfamily)